MKIALIIILTLTAMTLQNTESLKFLGNEEDHQILRDVLTDVKNFTHGFAKGSGLDGIEGLLQCVDNVPELVEEFIAAISEFEQGGDHIFIGIEKIGEIIIHISKIAKGCASINAETLEHYIAYLEKIVSETNKYTDGVSQNLANNWLSIIGKAWQLQEQIKNKEFFNLGVTTGEIFELVFYVNLDAEDTVEKGLYAHKSFTRHHKRRHNKAKKVLRCIIKIGFHTFPQMMKTLNETNDGRQSYEIVRETFKNFTRSVFFCVKRRHNKTVTEEVKVNIDELDTNIFLRNLNQTINDFQHNFAGFKHMNSTEGKHSRKPFKSGEEPRGHKFMGKDGKMFNKELFKELIQKYENSFPSKKEFKKLIHQSLKANEDKAQLIVKIEQIIAQSRANQTLALN